LRKNGKVNLSKEQFGATTDGARVELFTLNNDRGMEVKITNYGGIITSIKVPDRIGKVSDVVLGHDTLEGYMRRSRYFGAIIGRHANRIAGGKFSLSGAVYSLTQNNGENHLHGGVRGFDKVVWEARAINAGDGVGLELDYVSKDGEEGYPGNLRARVTYLLTEKSELRIKYFCATDKDTVVNLTNHSYFNLAGDGTVLGHQLLLNADQFTPVNQALIPTGELRNVSHTPMDFTRSSAIGARIDQHYEQLELAGGYDHNFILRGNGNGAALKPAAKTYEPLTGRLLEVFTTQPGIQFYSGNYLDGSIIGKGGRVYGKHAGCCFETQHFPDSPNQPSFPTTILKRAQRYEHETVFRFSVE
jgi:aldose 1-epimerase